MREIEILAPVGNFESLKAAVNNGADAVYLAGKKFGARSYANNFDNEEIVNAINYAHLYNVNVYVTINTLIYDQELAELDKYVTFLYQNNVDAVIIQDFGAICHIINKFPDLEVHASTQMTIHNVDGAKFLEDIGVKRVVVARESSIEEIKEISTNTNVEIEAFVHGALCVSYSGQCLMSSLIGGRSGNRGKCAQPCRKEYSLYNEEKLLSDSKYLLSTKDLATIKHIPDLIEAGVKSFKIEGRMKSPEYVGIIVKSYKEAINNHFNNKDKNNNDYVNNINKVYNRKYTTGHIMKDKYNNILNIDRQNNNGLDCGKVIKVATNKITVKLTNEIAVNDKIRIVDGNEESGTVVNKITLDGKSVNNALSSRIVDIYGNYSKIVKTGASVYKIEDNALVTQVRKTFVNEYYRKNTLLADIQIRKDQNPKAYVYVTNNEIVESTLEIELDVLPELSKNNPLTIEKVKNQLEKTGNTPYSLNINSIDLDNNLYLSIKDLNQLRRNIIDKVNYYKINKYQSRRIINVNYDFTDVYDKNNSNNDIELIVEVRTEEQLNVARSLGIKKIVTELNDNSNDIIKKEDVLYFDKNRDNHKHFEINNIGSMLLTNKTELKINADLGLNVTNSYTIYYLKKYNIKNVTLQLEHNKKTYNNIDTLLRDYCQIIIYGQQKVMYSKSCPMSVISNCKNCHKNKPLALEDQKGEKFTLFTNDECISKIYNSKYMLLIDEIKYLTKIGYSKFKIIFNFENEKETYSIIKGYQALINENNNEILKSIKEKLVEDNLFTKGYFNKNIE